MEWKHAENMKEKPKISTQNSSTTNPKPHKKEQQESSKDSEFKFVKLGSSFSFSSSNSEVVEISDLPCSTLINILGRLPLKTLFDCRHVCKSWRSLIGESYFYRSYSDHMPTTMILQVKGTSLETLKEITLIEQQSCGVIGGGSASLTHKMRRISNPCEPVVDVCNLGLNVQFQIGNGCNGLICLREIQTGEPSLVWNPIMGQFVILPKPSTMANDKVVAGFGLCEHTNLYKVLRIFHGKRDSSSKPRVEIYDLGVGEEWREIGDAPFPIPSKYPGVFTNNSLHWILDYHYKEDNGNGGEINKQIDAYGNNNNNNINDKEKSINSNFVLICGFDFAEEKFKVITAPPIYSLDQKSKYDWLNLGIIGNCLSICAIDAKAFRPDIHVWVMEEYGVPESWAIRLFIREPNVNWCDPCRWIQVTNFLKNGEILILCAHHYVLAYNVRERFYRRMEELNFPVIAHVPSFISLEDVLSDHHGTGSLKVRYL